MRAFRIEPPAPRAARAARAAPSSSRRFVRGDPIEARPQSAWTRLARRAWRRRALLGAIALVGALASTLGLLQLAARREADRLLRANYEREMRAAAITTQFALLSPARSPGTAYTIDPAGYFAPPPGRSGGRRSVEKVLEKLRGLAETLPDAPDAPYQSARALVALGREPEAIAELEKAIARDGGFAPARILLATILERRGEPEEARRLLEPVRAHESGWTRALLDARLGEEETRWGDAVKAYDRAFDEAARTAREPYAGARAQWLLGRGMAYLRAGEHARAIGDFAAAADRYRGALEPVLLLAQAWLHHGEGGAGAEAAEAILRAYQDRADPEVRDDVALAIASLYSSVGERTKALEWAEERMGDEALRERTRACLIVHRRPLAGAVAAEKAIEGYPRDPLAHVWLAWAHQSRGSQKTVIDHLRTALDLEPDHGLALFWLGAHLVRGGDLDGGIALLREAASATNTPLPFTRLAEALYLRGEKAEAEEQFRGSLNILERFFSQRLRNDPGHPSQEIARRSFGCFLLREKRIAELLDEYTGAIASRPEKTWARRDRLLSTAIALAESPIDLPEEPLGRAIEALEEARTAGPEGSPELQETLARLLVSRGGENDLPEALRHARRALEGSSARDITPLSLVADLEDRLQGPATAVLTLERALQGDADDPRLSLALAAYREKTLPAIASPASADALLDEGTTLVLVARGSSWRFLRGRREPSRGLEWTAPEFDDRDWEAGPAAFGYGLVVPEVGTLLDDMPGSYTTLYVRHRLEVTDPRSFTRLRLLVWADEGFIAYLNGVEVARAKAGPPETPVSCDGSALGQGVYDGVPRLFERALDPRLLEAGANCLAIHGLNHASRGQRSFYLAATLRATTRRDLPPERLLGDFRAVARSEKERGLLHYIEGRVLQREGKPEPAAEEFRLAIELDRSRPEPFLRLAECHRSASRSERAEEVLREALVAFGKERSLWRLRHEIASVDLDLGARELLARFGEVPSGGPGADLAWVIGRLGAEGRARINCGASKDTTLPSGALWGRDRFFRGGHPARWRYSGAIEGPGGPGDDEPYRTARWFPPRAGAARYSIPVPRGNFRVTLHFAEIGFLPPIRRRFTVLAEGEPALEEYEPPLAAIGSARAETKTFPLTVNDGFLDLELRHRLRDPGLCGIVIEEAR